MKWSIKNLETLLLFWRYSSIDNDHPIRDVCVKIGGVDIDGEIVDIYNMLYQCIQPIDLDHAFYLLDAYKVHSLVRGGKTVRRTRDPCLRIFIDASDRLY